MIQLILSNDHVVLHRDAWEALLGALADGDQTEAALAALTAPVEEGTFVIRESDVLAPQALYAYAANIRTAVEFTEHNGLSVMTDEARSDLNDLANEMVQLGCDWQEAQANAGATVQPADWGTLDS